MLSGQTGPSTGRATGATGPWQGGPVTDFTIRDAGAGDTEAIGRVAVAAGQDEEWSGSDPAGLAGPARWPGPGLPARAAPGGPAAARRRLAQRRPDLYMATDPGLLDPPRAVPSPAFA